MDNQLLDQTARDILRQNDKGTYTIPTQGLYPYQWNWDSAFAALGFACFDIERAWTELDTLFSGQWDNGMVPHILFHSQESGYFPGPSVWGCHGPIPSSGISQPPLAASMARFMVEKHPAVGLQRLPRLYDKLLAWHRWFMTWRLDQGAVCTTHPWEAGRDNAPDWDGAMARIDPVDVGEYTRCDTQHVDSSMRPSQYDYDRYVWLVKMGKRLGWNEPAMQAEQAFRVADPTLTFILLRAQRDLAILGRLLGRDVTEIEAAILQLEAGTTTLWNPQLKAYDARDVYTGQWAGSVSSASFLCWYAGLDAPAMEQTLADVMATVRYGIPSYDPRSEQFSGRRYWRGPVWGIMNMLIGTGMAERGVPTAQVLRESTAELIGKHGFAEYFDPRDGSPAGGDSFTWTAAIWLAWASPSTALV